MEKMNAKTLISIFAAILIGSSPLYADTNLYQTDPAVLKRLDELAKQVVDLQRLVQSQNEVIKSQAVEMRVFKEKHGEKPTVYIPGALEKKLIEAPSWLDGMKQGGDFRLRYEAFDNHGGTDQDRNRFRMRLRYGIEKTLDQDFTVGFRIATGSTTDPTSTMQTLGGNFVYKTVVFDKLFAKYVPSQLKGFGPITQVELGGGKVENPFLRASSQMVWDGDVTPEGVYQVIDFKALEFGGSKFAPFLIGGQFPVVENAGAGLTDAELYAVMGGFNLQTNVHGLEKPVAWTSSVAYYDYSDYTTNGNFGAFARGNSVDPNSATTLLAKDFETLNIYNQVRIETPWVPLVPFADFAKNLGNDIGSTKPGELDDAWGLGIKVGETKARGDWEVAYAYYWIEPNAVVGAFNDSDFGGVGFIGHSDRRGSLVRLGYKLTDHLTLNAAGIFVNTVTNSPDEETRRFQTDLNWKF